MSCCGKIICSGCFYAPVYDNQGNKVDKRKCAFCRTPASTSEEEQMNRLKKRVEVGNVYAINNLGVFYRDGKHGYSQDMDKALELFIRAGELGYAGAYCCIGYMYDLGTGVGIDKEKAAHYYELGAIGGDAVSRCNLALDEKSAGNMDRALKHFMIAVVCGDALSLSMIKEMYSKGYATKEDYTEALRSYQAYLGEIKSDQRDKAAAAREEYRYYE